MGCLEAQTAWTLWTGYPSTHQVPNFPRLIAPLQNYPNKYAPSLFPGGICNFSYFCPTLIKFWWREEIVIGAMPEMMMNLFIWPPLAFNQTKVCFPGPIICINSIWNYPTHVQEMWPSRKKPQRLYSVCKSFQREIQLFMTRSRKGEPLGKKPKRL